MSDIEQSPECQMMDATKNRPLYGCTNCYEEYSWPAADLAVYEGECWCENCWHERRWEGELPYWSDLDDFVPEHEIKLRAEREKVRVLRRSLDHIKVRSYELGQKELHDMALEALQATAPGAGGGE